MIIKTWSSFQSTPITQLLPIYHSHLLWCDYWSLKGWRDSFKAPIDRKRLSLPTWLILLHCRTLWWLPLFKRSLHSSLPILAHVWSWLFPVLSDMESLFKAGFCVALQTHHAHSSLVPAALSCHTSRSMLLQLTVLLRLWLSLTLASWTPPSVT